jgi:hypothetical protein
VLRGVVAGVVCVLSYFHRSHFFPGALCLFSAIMFIYGIFKCSLTNANINSGLTLLTAEVSGQKSVPAPH